MREGTHEFEGGPFQVSADRVDDKVAIKIYRGADLLVEIQTTRNGANNIAAQIMRVLY
ncbi:hypothetical protein J2R95_003157 [Bradyrhizobium japonicum]|uniref:hypothetical protein n=1 Tax=Bradyrhizobium japonicum TaxID=375 RepID=UPI00209ED9A2|nr:hypothetical protein [Bradyrhizobium japonicum]MCP1937362.1 hypothetical protein [Bradyrhizobium japonicum]